MTVTAGDAPAQIELAQGDLAVVPVPEGRVVLRNEQRPGEGRVQSVILLLPHGEVAPHELARFSSNTEDASRMLTLALAALEAWR